MDNSVQLDFATMALKGQRYDEAEKIYMNLAMQAQSAEAWIGLGITKLYQLANGRTVDEAAFCFQKAFQIDNDKKNDIDDQLMYHSQVVIQAYAKVVEAAVAKHAAEQKKANWAIAITAASAFVGSRSNSAYGTIASLGATGAGVGVAIDAFSNMSDLKQIVSTVLSKSDEVRAGVVKNVDTSRDEFKAFEQFVQNVVNNLQLVLGPPQKSGSSGDFRNELTSSVTSLNPLKNPLTNPLKAGQLAAKGIGGLFKKKG